MKRLTVLTLSVLLMIGIAVAAAATSLSIGTQITVKNPPGKNWLVVLSNTFGTNPTFTCPTTGYTDSSLNIPTWNVAQASTNSTIICLFNGSQNSQTFTVTGPTVPTGVTFSAGPQTATMASGQTLQITLTLSASTTATGGPTSGTISIT